MPPDAVDPSGHIPIVCPALVNPVERGFAVDLSRPGGNITGFTLMHAELNAKRLELLRTAFPHISKVAALVNPTSPGHKWGLEQIETAARTLGLGSVARVEARRRGLARGASGGLFENRRRGRCPRGTVLSLPPGHNRARQRGAFARHLPRA